MRLSPGGRKRRRGTANRLQRDYAPLRDYAAIGDGSSGGPRPLDRLALPTQSRLAERVRGHPRRRSGRALQARARRVARSSPHRPGAAKCSYRSPTSRCGACSRWFAALPVGCANSIGPLLRPCLLEPDLGDGPADLFDVVDVDRVYEHVRSPNTRKLVESAPLRTLPLSEHLAKALCDLGRSLINEQFVTALKNDPRRHGAASVARCP